MAVRLLFALLTVAALILAFLPTDPTEEAPAAATGGSLAFAACFGLIAIFPTWRGLLLGLAAGIGGLAVVPPVTTDAEPATTSTLALVSAAVLAAFAVWPFIGRFRRRIASSEATKENTLPLRLGEVRWSALLTSWIVDIVGSSLFGLALVVAAIAVGRLPTSLMADSTELTSALTSQPGLFAASFAGGLFFSIIAGYVSARLAGVHLLMYGLLSSAACLATDLASRDSLALLPAWLVVVGVLLAPAAGLFGGHVRALELRRQPAAA